jgi:hypothetical protein
MGMKKNLKKDAAVSVFRTLLVASVLAFASCDVLMDAIIHESEDSEPASRTFYAYNIETKSYYQITADKKYVGEHSIIFVEQGQTVEADTAREVGIEFDTNVYGKIRDTFAHEEDVDKNGKVILLLLDVKDGYNESGGYVAGYFDSTHMLSKTTNSRSNEADMLFMDTNPGLEDRTDFYITMAHEFQHLVNYSEKVIRQKAGDQDLWINEGLSAAAEYVYLNGQNQWKIDYYNMKQSLGTNYSPNIDANLWGQNFVSWGVWGDPLVNYSTVYLFFQWLRVHAVNTTGIYKDILASPFNDYRAVQASVLSRFADYPGTSWKDIFRDWLVANYVNASTGFYGYKNDLKDASGYVQYLYPRYFTSIAPEATGPSAPFTSAGEAQLFPSEAVYVKLSENKTLSDTDVLGYASVTTDGISVNIEPGSTYYQNDILVARNFSGKGRFVSKEDFYSSSSLLTPSGTTQVATSTLTPPAASMVPKSAKPARTRYPIDAILGPETEVQPEKPLLELRKGR